jgi:hypothetical protein
MSEFLKNEGVINFFYFLFFINIFNIDYYYNNIYNNINKNNCIEPKN